MSKSPNSNNGEINLYWRITPPDDRDYLVKKHGEEIARVWDRVDRNHTPEEEKMGYVSWTEVCKAHELSSKVLNDPFFGLKTALEHREDFSNAGPLVFILNRSKNMRHFADMFIKYQALHTNGIRFAYEEDLDNQALTVILTFHPMSGPHRQTLEHTTGLTCAFFYRFLHNFQVKHVSFQHKVPNDLSAYTEAFGDAQVSFNAPRNTITTDLKYLNMDRSSLIMKALRKSLDLYFSRQLRHYPFAKKSIAESVTEILPSLMGAKSTSLNAVAGFLGMHSKKLQRLLKDEGTSYKVVLDNVRKFQAARLLEDSDMSISTIAQFLDYSSNEALNSAFKRWFGMSPSVYRKRSREVSDPLLLA